MDSEISDAMLFKMERNKVFKDPDHKQTKILFSCFNKNVLYFWNNAFLNFTLLADDNPVEIHQLMKKIGQVFKIGFATTFH